MLKKTPLYGLHLELGGKMTEFAGYQLPVNYRQGIIEEHLHCRQQAGLFDISHMGQFAVTGHKAVAEIESLTPSHLTALKPGQQKYTVITNEQGGIIDDIIVTRMDIGLRLVVNAACKQKDYQHLASNLSRDCRLTEESGKALLALQGPAACAVIRQYSGLAGSLPFMHACDTSINGMPCTISRCGYTGEDGFEIAVNNDHAEALARLLLAVKNVMPIGLGSRDTLRLEAGLCLYGHELDEHITPVEAGLSWLIQKNRTDYPGAEIILQQIQSGPEQIRAGLLIEGKAPVRQGHGILDNHNNAIGVVTSGSYAPSLGRPVAMMRIHKSCSRLGAKLSVKVRDKLISATVASLPFLPHRYQR